MEIEENKLIENDELIEEIKIFKETGEKTEELGRMILVLAQRYSNSGKFASYTWKDDMVCDAVYTCLKYLKNINPYIENSNPLSYFKLTIFRSFLNYIAKQKKHIKIKDTCYNNADLVLNEGFREDEISFFDVHGIDYQQIKGKKKKKKKKNNKNK